MSTFDRGTAICTWFAADTLDTATYFPQVGMMSDDTNAQAVYWRCVCVFFATSSVRNAGMRHIFFTNSPIPLIDGIDVGRFLEFVGVEVVTLPLTYRLTQGSVESWGNQFYVLDIINHIASAGDAERYIVLDSDCVWVKSAGGLADAIQKHGLVAYDINYDTDYVVNGATQSQLAEFVDKVTGLKRNKVTYCGGEMLAATRSEIIKISAQAENFWAAIKNEAPPYLREEAQFLSCIYAVNGYDLKIGERYIKRMWTTFGHNNVSPDDLALCIWHLPAEKHTGFMRAFKRIFAALHRGEPLDFIFEEGGGFLGQVMGVPKRGTEKFVRDAVSKLKQKMKA